MGIGTIVYYILWPAVLVALLIFWIFKISTFLVELGVESIQNLHEDIKKL